MSDLPLPEAILSADDARSWWATTQDEATDRLYHSHEALRRRAEKVEPLVALLEASRREHLYVEDCWYSCPKSIDGCCDDRQGDECNCGADAWNARVDAALAGVRGPESAECPACGSNDPDVREVDDILRPCTDAWHNRRAPRKG